MSIPCGSMGWCAVCVCSISLSYSLTFFIVPLGVPFTFSRQYLYDNDCQIMTAVSHGFIEDFEWMKSDKMRGLPSILCFFATSLKK